MKHSFIHTNTTKEISLALRLAAELNELSRALIFDIDVKVLTLLALLAELNILSTVAS
jgi:hypothetical protein